jgi:hypothetical protein
MIEIGNIVRKKSGKPFKNGNQIQTVIGVGVNEVDPKKRECVIFDDNSVCNICLLELVK